MNFVQHNLGDPATKVCFLISMHGTYSLWWSQDFMPKLRAHILPRILALHQGIDQSNDVSLNVGLGDASDAPADSPAKLTDVIFKGNRIYRHRLLRVNYTTYEVQHESDAINPHTNQCDIMLQYYRA